MWISLFGKLTLSKHSLLFFLFASQELEDLAKNHSNIHILEIGE